MKIFFTRFLLTTLIASISISNLQGQVETNDSIKLHKINPIIPRIIIIESLLKQSYADFLTGCICDPVYQRLIGISVLAGNQNPNIGFGISADPIFWRYLKANIQYRTDFNKNYKIYSSLETKNILLKFPIDLLIEYSNYSLSNQKLLQYEKISWGINYTRLWGSYGILLGWDEYNDRDMFGFDVLVRYDLHKATGECCVKYLSLGKLTANFGLWGKNFNYKIIYDFPSFNLPISLGIGYEKTYDFEELQIAIKYLFPY